MDERQERIIATLRNLAKDGRRVPFQLLRVQPGCSPNTIKAAFGGDAGAAARRVYEYVYALAGLVYSDHTDRKPNNFWRDRNTRLREIKRIVRDLASHAGVSEIDAARGATRDDFARGRFAPALCMYYGGSPELAIRDAYGIYRRGVRGEFNSWAAAQSHLERCLRPVDCDALTEERFKKLVPGWQAILRKHGGFVAVMDRSGLRLFDAFRHTAPPGYWNHLENRIRWVRELVRRVREERGSSTVLPDYSDFERLNLEGLLASRGMTFRQLLREAGFHAPDPPDWTQVANRVQRIREIVEAAGGPHAVTFDMILAEEPGLADWYSSHLAHNGTAYPRLYLILREAAYEVTPDDCNRGLGGRRRCRSSHGDCNDSRWQAAMDEWIFELAGDRHRHNVNYPGQSDPSHPLNCDFVILRPDDDDPCHGLWIEFAGMAGAGSSVGQKYAERILRKRELATRHGLKLLIVTPADLKADPEQIPLAITAAAPWLQAAATQDSAAWRRLRRIPSSDAFAFVMQKWKKYSDADLVNAIRKRMENWRRNPKAFPLNIGACQKEPGIRAIYLACVRRPGGAGAQKWPDWADWLERAGFSKEEAARVARIRQRHDPSQTGVLRELSAAYQRAIEAHTWPGREPALNGALRRRAIRAFGAVTAARAAAKRTVGRSD